MALKYLDETGLAYLWGKMKAKFVNISEPKIDLDTTATSGTDHDLYAAIVALGWQNDVIV